MLANVNSPDDDDIASSRGTSVGGAGKNRWRINRRAEKLKILHFQLCFHLSPTRFIMILLAKLKILSLSRESLLMRVPIVCSQCLKQFTSTRNLTLVGKSWILNCLIIMLECHGNKNLPISFHFVSRQRGIKGKRKESYQVASSSIRLACTAGIFSCAWRNSLWNLSLRLLTRSFSFSFVIPTQ